MQPETRRCQVCGRYYDSGTRRLCRACQRDKGKPKAWRWKKCLSLRCDCGAQAVTVMEVKVGLNGAYRVLLPLCAGCYRLEMGEDPLPSSLPDGDP